MDILQTLQRHGYTAYVTRDDGIAITGGVYEVTYYPRTKRIKISGTTTPASAITGDLEYALQCTRIIPTRATRVKNAVRERLGLDHHGRYKLKLDMWRRKQACDYCHAKIPFFVDARLDHYIPLSRSGSNSRDNLRLCCGRCDKIKRDKLPHEFLPRITRIISHAGTNQGALHPQVETPVREHQDSPAGGPGADTDTSR